MNGPSHGATRDISRELAPFKESPTRWNLDANAIPILDIEADTAGITHSIPDKRSSGIQLPNDRRKLEMVSAVVIQL